MIASLLVYLFAIGNPLDITASGLDYWVACCAPGGRLTVHSSSGHEVSMPCLCTNTSLTIQKDSVGVPGNLIVMRSLNSFEDSSKIYLLDPGTLATLGHSHVPYAQICPPASVHYGCSVTQLEAQNVIDGDTDCVVFASVQTNYTLSGSGNRTSDCTCPVAKSMCTQDHSWQSAAIIDMENPGQMTLREPAAIEMNVLCATSIPPVQTGPLYWVSGWGDFSCFNYGTISMVQVTGYGGSSGSGSLDTCTLERYYQGGRTAHRRLARP